MTAESLKSQLRRTLLAGGAHDGLSSILVREPCLLMDADVLYSRELLDRLIDAPAADSLLLNRKCGDGEAHSRRQPARRPTQDALRAGG